MKRLVSATLLIVLVFSLCACGGTSNVEATPEPVAFSDNPEAISAASESVVMLTCYDKNGDAVCTGSAFQCFEEGIFVTNYHVIENADTIQANTEDKLYFDIDEIVAVSEEKDVAILKTSANPRLAVLKDGDTEALVKGADIVAIGSPQGFLNTVSKGTYSGAITTGEGRDYIQFSAAISAGSSGGALFNDNGEVVGITSASYMEGQNLNFAVPVNTVREVWENKEEYATPEEPDRDWMTVEEYYANFDDVRGQTVRVGAYVSSNIRYNMDQYINYFTYVVDSKSDVLGADFADSIKSSDDKRKAANIEDEKCEKRIALIIRPKEFNKEDFAIGKFVVMEGTAGNGSLSENISTYALLNARIVDIETDAIISSADAFSVEELSEDYRNLSGTTVTVEGYISSAFHCYYYRNGNKHDNLCYIFLVDNKDDVYGYSGSHEMSEISLYCKEYSEEIKRQEAGESLQYIMTFKEEDLQKYVPGEFVTLQGMVAYADKYSNSMSMYCTNTSD